MMVGEKTDTTGRKYAAFEYARVTDHIYLGMTPWSEEHFIWLPVVHATAPSEKHLLIGAKAIKGSVDDDAKVYVCCKKGQDRSITWLRHTLLWGVSASFAAQKVRDCRPVHLKRSQLKALSRFQHMARVLAIEDWLQQS